MGSGDSWKSDHAHHGHWGSGGSASIMTLRNVPSGISTCSVTLSDAFASPAAFSNAGYSRKNGAAYWS